MMHDHEFRSFAGQLSSTSLSTSEIRTALQKIFKIQQATKTELKSVIDAKLVALQIFDDDFRCLNDSLCEKLPALLQDLDSVGINLGNGFLHPWKVSIVDFRAWVKQSQTCCQHLRQFHTKIDVCKASFEAVCIVHKAQNRSDPLLFQLHREVPHLEQLEKLYTMYTTLYSLQYGVCEPFKIDTAFGRVDMSPKAGLPGIINTLLHFGRKRDLIRTVCIVG